MTLKQCYNYLCYIFLRCDNKDYGDTSTFPKTSVFMCFHESEILSHILHTVHSIVQRTPRHLLEEIILIADNSKKGMKTLQPTYGLTPPLALPDANFWLTCVLWGHVAQKLVPGPPYIIIFFKSGHLILSNYAWNWIFSRSDLFLLNIYQIK